MKRSLSLLFLLLLAAPALAQRPVMERVRPTAGPPGTRVQLIGRHLGHRSQAFLGDKELRVVERLPNRWTLEIPPGAESGPILLRTRQGTYAGPRFRVTAARPAPEISGLEPSSAPPGAEVTIIGRHFSARLGDNEVTLGGEPVVVRSATPTEIRVLIPTDASSGTFRVEVDGAVAAAESPRFELTVGTAITAVEPPRAPPGSDVILRGTGFSPRAHYNRVRLAGRQVRVVSATATELKVRLPRRGISSGRFEVQIRTGGSATSPPFEVAEPVVVTGFEPRSGPPGTAVTIEGSGFGRDVRPVEVKLGERPVRVRVVTPTAIQVMIPSGAPTAPFTVSIGGLASQSDQPFRSLQTLAVESFRPHRGAPGTVVTIRGQGFAPDPDHNVVTLGDVRQTVVAASPEELRVRIADAPSAPLQVSAHGDTARSSRPFVVMRPPSIESFSPHSGPIGTHVTLVGNGFGTSANLVRATMGRRRMRVISVQDDRLVVEVPRGVRRQRIEVRVGTRGGTVTGEEFVVGRRQRVSGLSPSHGIVGSELVIRGEGFPRDAIRVAFTGPRRAIRAQRVSPVELRVIVPNGARTGPVALLLGEERVPVGTFTVDATPEGVAVTAVEPRCAYAGCVAILRGHGFASQPRRNRVSFRGERVEVRRATATTLEIVLPAETGNGRFVVDVRGAGTGTSPPFYLQRRP